MRLSGQWRCNYARDDGNAVCRRQRRQGPWRRRARLHNTVVPNGRWALHRRRIAACKIVGARLSNAFNGQTANCKNRPLPSRSLLPRTWSQDADTSRHVTALYTNRRVLGSSRCPGRHCSGGGARGRRTVAWSDVGWLVRLRPRVGVTSLRRCVVTCSPSRRYASSDGDMFPFASTSGTCVSKAPQSPGSVSARQRKHCSARHANTHHHTTTAFHCTTTQRMPRPQYIHNNNQIQQPRSRSLAHLLVSVQWCGVTDSAPSQWLRQDVKRAGSVAASEPGQPHVRCKWRQGTAGYDRPTGHHLCVNRRGRHAPGGCT